MSNQLVSTKEASAMFGCSEAAIRKWCYQGRLKPVKLGRLVRFRREDVERISREGLS